MKWEAVVVIAAGDELWVGVEEGFDDVCCWVGAGLGLCGCSLSMGGRGRTLSITACLVDGELCLLCFGVHLGLWIIVGVGVMTDCGAGAALKFRGRNEDHVLAQSGVCHHVVSDQNSIVGWLATLFHQRDKFIHVNFERYSKHCLFKPYSQEPTRPSLAESQRERQDQRRGLAETSGSTSRPLARLARSSALVPPTSWRRQSCCARVR